MKIFVKKLLFYLTKGSQVLFRNKSSSSRSITLLPLFDNKNDLNDQISRLRWYIPEKYLTNKITILVHNSLRNQINEVIYPKCHREYPNPDIINKIKIKFVGSNYITPNSDIFCIWKFTFKRFLNLIFKNPFSIRLIDPNFFKYAESHTYPGLLWYDLYNENDRLNLKRHSKSLFEEFYEKKKSDKVVMFGTGPSINSVFNNEYSNNTTIICNSIVKDDRLLEKIHPDAITFIDVVFHFGVSKYCEKFISDVEKTVLKYNSYCFINEVGGALIYEHFPNLRKNLICFPTYRIGSPNAIKPDNFKSRFYAESVVTRIMLQLGAGLSNKVYLCGFDGRAEGEDYFWKHSPVAQYDDLMQDVWDSHPTFFSDTDYLGHYKKHCLVMNNVIEKLEGKGIQIYSLEKSFIPALSNRYSSIN